MKQTKQNKIQGKKKYIAELIKSKLKHSCCMQILEENLSKENTHIHTLTHTHTLSHTHTHTLTHTHTHTRTHTHTHTHTHTTKTYQTYALFHWGRHKKFHFCQKPQKNLCLILLMYFNDTLEKVHCHSKCIQHCMFKHILSMFTNNQGVYIIWQQS